MSTGPYQVRLGGVSRGRSLLATNRNRLETAGLVVCVVVGLLIAAQLQSVVGLVVALLLLAVGFVMFTPIKGESLAAVAVKSWRWHRHHRQGLTAFQASNTVVGDSRKVKKLQAAQVEAPAFLGAVTPVVVNVGGGNILVLIHQNPGELGYASVALEVETKTPGLSGQDEINATYAKWARFKALLAQEQSLVRVMQQVERVQPASVEAHMAWLASRADLRADSLLVDSYDSLLQQASWSGESHHSLLVLRMPFNNMWSRRCHGEFGVQDQSTRAKLAVLEAQRVASIALRDGIFRVCRPLGERKFSAAVRACLNPSFSMDDVREAGIRGGSCWREWEAKPDHVVVDGQWFLRTAQVPAYSLPNDVVPVDLLHPLVVGIYPSVVRSIAITEELIPAPIARRATRHNLTVDTAKARESARLITDGSELVQLSATQLRIADLRPGSGHHAVNAAIHLTVAGKSLEELQRATHQVDASAADLGLQLRWLHKQQDLALATTLPLGMGLKTRRRRDML